MTTHEREITEPVDLCLPNGRILDLASRGWSRRPLHRANLRGRRLRTKKWDYWGILADDVAIAVTYADVGFLGMVDLWWLHHPSGRSGGRSTPVPFARGVSLPDRFGTEPLRFDGRGVSVDISDDGDGTEIRARWEAADGPFGSGPGGEIEARIDLPEDLENLHVVIPWTTRTYQYTAKHQARPARGVLRVGDEEHAFGLPADADLPAAGNRGGAAWGVLDVGRGRWPYSTRWNWGGGAGIAVDGETVVGIQLGAKWTEGSGATENGITVNGRLTKIGDEMPWEYDWDHPMEPWRVRHPDGSVDLTLTPTHDKYTGTNAGVLKMVVHQVFGRWTGHVTDGETGRRVEVDGVLGFAEECRARW